MELAGVVAGGPGPRGRVALDSIENLARTAATDRTGRRRATEAAATDSTGTILREKRGVASTAGLYARRGTPRTCEASERGSKHSPETRSDSGRLDEHGKRRQSMQTRGKKVRGDVRAQQELGGELRQSGGGRRW